MILRIAYGKLLRANSSSNFTPGTAITTYVESDAFSIQPLGGAGTAAPSTLVIDGRTNFHYTLAKPFSATHAAMTAATATSNQISLI